MKSSYASRKADLRETLKTAPFDRSPGGVNLAGSAAMEHPDKYAGLLDPEDPHRREFALRSILAMLAGVTITISACGDDDSPTSPSPPGGDGRAGSVSANHGHSATITAGQLTAGNAVMLDIRGQATHPHTVELSAAEVGQIAAGQRVSKVSSTDDSPDAGRHSHIVTFN